MSPWNSSVFILLPLQKIASIFIFAGCKGICQYFQWISAARNFETLSTVAILWGLWCLRPADYFFWTDGRQIGAVRSKPQLSMNSRLSANTFSQQCPPMLCCPPTRHEERDNIWWLFRHFSPFSPEFCLSDKAMIFNRGLIESSHVLLSADTISTSTVA